MRVSVGKAIPVVSAFFNFISTRHEESVMYDDVLPRGSGSVVWCTIGPFVFCNGKFRCGRYRVGLVYTVNLN